VNLNKKIVILGGGQSAAYAAKEIRINDNKADITIISEEKVLAYERPPLSKDYITDKKKLEDFTFFNSEFYSKNNIEYIKNTKIINLDFQNKILFSQENNQFTYDKLLIATGSVNRNIDLNIENNNDKILSLRNKEDSDRIKNKLKESKKVLIIGGGFIGLEIAASANELGKEIYIIEMNDQLMGRIIPKKISNFCKKIHEINGNKIYLNTTIKKIISSKNSYEIKLSNNKTIFVDLIILGIGSIANTELFKDKDIKIDNGIVTNEYCETSQKDVYAAGDVSNFFHPFYNKNIRLESYQHAQNHGICAGKNIIGIKEAYNSIPWMWSDQLNINIQLTGLCEDFDKILQRGNNIDEGVIDFFIKDNEIKGACGIGIKGKIGRDIKLATKILEKKLKIDVSNIVDKNFNMSKMIKKI
tara:strand:+ start:1314 stop:2558 length:1245 start_codon:yes stop_codon:yes gene_type:complete